MDRGIEEVAAADAAAVLVGVAGDDPWRLDGELGDALENVLRGVGREVGDELVVDGQVWGQDEKVPHALLLVKVGNEGSHEPRLAYPGGERKAERRKVSLEVGDRRKLRLDGPEGLGGIRALLQGNDFAQPR